MGANVSQTVNEKATESINVNNSVTQNCIVSNMNTEANDICIGAQCGSNASVTQSGISFSETTRIDVSCGQSVMITTNIQQNISQAMKLAATAVAQQFQMSEADVNQVANVGAMLGAAIGTTLVQNCYSSAWNTQQNTIGCNSVDGNGACFVNITNLTFDENSSQIVNCILQDTQVQGITQSITQSVQAKGKSKVQSIFGPLGGLILIILIIVGYIFYKGEAALTDYRLWLVVVLAVFLYLAVAFALAWFPFDKRAK